jgi:hypothetical protein
MTDVDARAREALELDDSAVASPWESCPHLKPACDCPCGYTGDVFGGGMVVCQFGREHADHVDDAGCGCHMRAIGTLEQRIANAALISRYRTLCPALARDVQRLRRIEELAKDAAPLMSCTSATRAECPACNLRHALAVEEESCDCPIHGRQLGTVCPRC